MKTKTLILGSLFVLVTLFFASLNDDERDTPGRESKASSLSDSTVERAPAMAESGIGSPDDDPGANGSRVVVTMLKIDEEHLEELGYGWLRDSFSTGVSYSGPPTLENLKELGPHDGFLHSY